MAESSSASTEQVSASAQQTSASTQEIAASAQGLADQATRLEQLVGQFVLAGIGAAILPPLVMPKMKSHSGAKKRFKVTGTGKVQAPPRVLEPHPREEVAEAQAPDARARSRIVEGRRASRATKLLGGNGR